MDKLRARDTIGGKEGRAYVKIDGNNELLFNARNVEATVEKIKAEVKSLGHRVTGHKTTGLNCTGSMTLYYMTPTFRRLISQYKDTGQDVYFDMVIENDDPSSDAGRQSVLLRDVNLDSTLIAKIDGDSDDPLEEDVDFTFEDYEILEHFNAL